MYRIIIQHILQLIKIPVLIFSWISLRFYLKTNLHPEFIKVRVRYGLSEKCAGSRQKGREEKS